MCGLRSYLRGLSPQHDDRRAQQTQTVQSPVALQSPVSLIATKRPSVHLHFGRQTLEVVQRRLTFQRSSQSTFPSLAIGLVEQQRLDAYSRRLCFDRSQSSIACCTVFSRRWRDSGAGVFDRSAALPETVAWHCAPSFGPQSFSTRLDQHARNPIDCQKLRQVRNAL